MQPISFDTTGNRGIINTRDEKLGELDDYHRLHHISNDGNMCETALLLKRGIRHLALLLYENNLLPNIPYNKEKAVSDIKSLSSKLKDWELRGTFSEFKSVCKVIDAYYAAMKGEFYGMDSELDLAMNVLSEVKEDLKKVPSSLERLVGRLDWATQWHILNPLANDSGRPLTDDLIQDNALDYFRIDKEGLFYWMQERGWIEKVVTDNHIEYLRKNAPRTRALGRSLLAKKKKELQKRGINLRLEWNGAYASLSTPFDEEGRFVHLQPIWSYDMKNPFNQYEDAVISLERKLKILGI